MNRLITLSIALIVLLMTCSAIATEPIKPAPTFGLGEPTEVQDVTYYAVVDDGPTFGLGSRIIRRREVVVTERFGLRSTSYAQPVVATVARRQTYTKLSLPENTRIVYVEAAPRYTEVVECNSGYTTSNCSNVNYTTSSNCGNMSYASSDCGAGYSMSSDCGSGVSTRLLFGRRNREGGGPFRRILGRIRNRSYGSSSGGCGY